MKKMLVVFMSLCFMAACSHHPSKDRSSAGCADCSKSSASCPDCKDKKSSDCDDCKK